MKILIVVDMQNDFIDGVLGNAETRCVLEPVCKKVSNFLKNTDGKIIYTMDTHHENYSETQEGKNLHVKHCIENTDGWKLAGKLDEILSGEPERCIQVRKVTFGAETLPDAIKQIQQNDNDVDEIELCGVCTDICVISNAMLLKAFFPEIPVAVDSSCCAGVTPDSHNNALNAMKMCQIKVR